MNRYKATLDTIIEAEDEEDAMEEFCSDICKCASGEVQLELLNPEKDQTSEEKEYIINLIVKVTDRILIRAKNIKEAKSAAKRAFFSNLSEYQVVNAAVEHMDIEIEKER